MIDSYSSARCSGRRRSFQCTTAKAVSMTGLRAKRRMFGRCANCGQQFVAMRRRRRPRCRGTASRTSEQERGHGLVREGFDMGLGKARRDGFLVGGWAAGDDQPALAVLGGGTLDSRASFPGQAIGGFIQSIQHDDAVPAFQLTPEKICIQAPLVLLADRAQVVRQPRRRIGGLGRRGLAGMNQDMLGQFAEPDEDGKSAAASCNRCGAASGAMPSCVSHRTCATRRRKVVLPAPGSPMTSNRSCCKAACNGCSRRGWPRPSASLEPLARRPAGPSNSSAATVMVSDMYRSSMGNRLACGLPVASPRMSRYAVASSKSRR